MRDWMGRDLHYLRLSLTERCNLKCIYCREETDFCKAKQELNLRELTQLMNVMVRLGVTKVRLTGGEPLVRKDLEQIIHMVSGYTQIQDLSMTTNAQGLCARIQQLHRRLAAREYQYGLSGPGTLSPHDTRRRFAAGSQRH